ncbi:MAG: creatininase family protein [Thermomicrobiales bacterium]
MAEPILLAQRSWPETRDLLRANEVVLLPVGAHEQHGPGIAMATDTISADGLCRRAAALLGERAAVAPAVPFGVSWHHMHFPGTITLTPETLTTLLVEIVSSLAQHGFPRVAIVNGHGGNSAAIATAVETLRQRVSGTRVIGLFGYAFIGEQARILMPEGSMGHGGGDEAAVVYAEAPDYAKPAAFCAPEPHAGAADFAAQLRAYGGVAGAYYDEITANGATGDTRHATPAVGNEILTRAAANLARLLEAFIVQTTNLPVI